MHASRFCGLLLLSVMMIGWPAPSALAQDRPAIGSPANTAPLPEPPNKSFPTTFKPSFQWNYVCPRETPSAGCSLRCLPSVSISSVLTAQVWLGTNDLGTESIPTVYYHFIYHNGKVRLTGSGFAHSTRTLSCQVVGLRVSYSGPPK